MSHYGTGSTKDKLTFLYFCSKVIISMDTRYILPVYYRWSALINDTVCEHWPKNFKAGLLHDV